MRLPKECRFPDAQREVIVHRDGGRVILEPVDEWSAEFRACLGAWPREIPRLKQPRIVDLRTPDA